MKKILLTLILFVGTMGMATGCSCAGDNGGAQNPLNYVATEMEQINLDEVHFDSAEISIPVGGTRQVKISTSEQVLWSIKDTKIATVSATGVVTALEGGRTMLCATVGEKEYSCVVVVEPKVAYLAITLDKTNISGFSIGSQMQIQADLQCSGMDDVVLQWSSSDESIVKILSNDNNGCYIEAKSEGNVEVTASYQNVKAVCKVNVIGATETNYSGVKKLNAIDGANSIARSVFVDSPADDKGDGQPYNFYQYSSGGGFSSNTYLTISSTTDEIKGKQARYKIGTKDTWNIGYASPQIGFKLDVNKEDLILYKKYSNFTQLAIDVLISPANNLNASGTRYIDVLSGFNEAGIGQYTRRSVDMNAWVTLTYDIDFIIDNYNRLANTEYTSGYCLFKSPNDNNLNNLAEKGGTYDNVTAAPGCPTSVGGGNIGLTWTVWLGEIAFTAPEPIDLTKYQNQTSVSAIDGVNGIVRGTFVDEHTRGDGKPYNFYQYSSGGGFAGETYTSISATAETVGGQQAKYKVCTKKTWSVGYATPQFGFKLSLSKEDLTLYQKHSGLTKLAVSFYMQPYNNGSLTGKRYLDVLTGFNTAGIGQYERRAFDVNTWVTVTFDMDFIIEYYDKIVDTNYDSGYCLFKSPNDNNLSNLSANGGTYDNVTEARDCLTSVGGGNMGTDWTVWLSDVVLMKD